MTNNYTATDFIYNIDSYGLSTLELGEDSLTAYNKVSLQQLLRMTENAYNVSSVILGLEEEFNRFITLEEFLIEYLPYPKDSIKEIIVYLDEPYTLKVRDIFCKQDILYVDIVENIKVCKINKDGSMAKIGDLPLGLQQYPVNRIEWVRIPNNYLWRFISLGI